MTELKTVICSDYWLVGEESQKDKEMLTYRITLSLIVTLETGILGPADLL